MAATAAQAQGGLQMRVTARTDSGGASPTCMMQFQLTNGTANRISTFSAEIRAVHAQTGAALRLPMATVPFLGIDAGTGKSWDHASASNVRCEQVRLQVVSQICVRRCGPAAWIQDGLAGVEILPR